MQEHPTIKLIRQSGYLPKIPKIFGETLNMLLEPSEFNMDECIERLAVLPGLESTLIQALNYSSKLRRAFITLKDAVVYLGAKNTRMIVIAYITKLLLPNKDGRAKIFDNGKYWKHCVGTAIASYMIADKTGLCDKEKIFTYGLIHDIGINVLDICLPNHLDRIYTMQLQKGTHQIVAEKVVLNGITHMEIGMWLCKEWGLPREIAEIVGYHHSPFINTEVSNELKIMHLADFISTKYYEKLLGTNTTFMYVDRARELLNLPEEFMENVAERLPQELEKIGSIPFFAF